MRSTHLSPTTTALLPRTLMPVRLSSCMQPCKGERAHECCFGKEAARQGRSMTVQQGWPAKNHPAPPMTRSTCLAAASSWCHCHPSGRAGPLPLRTPPPPSRPHLGGAGHQVRRPPPHQHPPMGWWVKAGLSGPFRGVRTPPAGLEAGTSGTEWRCHSVQR